LIFGDLGLGSFYINNERIFLKTAFLVFAVNWPTVFLMIVVSAVNSLSGRTKLTIGKPPIAKSAGLRQIDILLVYGFEVI